MKRAIVTGATGFVGRHLVRALARHSIEITAVVREISDKTEFLRSYPSVRILVCPLVNLGELPVMLGKAEDETVFYHLGWEGTAGEARANHQVQLANVSYTLDALETAQRTGCDGFVGAGSLMEYESTAAVYDLTANPSQANIYSTAKLTAHYMSRIKAADGNIRYVWPYITNAYGEDEVSARFLNTTVRNILTGQEMNFSAATQLYDFIHIDDVAEAFYLVGQYGKNGKTYCVGSGAPRSLKEYIIAIRDAIDKRLLLRFGDKPGICLEAKYFDTASLVQDTGFQPKVSFGEGIERVKKRMEAIK